MKTKIETPTPEGVVEQLRALLVQLPPEQRVKFYQDDLREMYVELTKRAQTLKGRREARITEVIGLQQHAERESRERLEAERALVKQPIGLGGTGLGVDQEIRAEAKTAGQRAFPLTESSVGPHYGLILRGCLNGFAEHIDGIKQIVDISELIEGYERDDREFQKSFEQQKRDREEAKERERIDRLKKVAEAERRRQSEVDEARKLGLI